MTRLVIKKIILDEYNLEHIKKHGVAREEVEEAVNNFIAHKKAKEGRYIVIGRAGLRLISMIIMRKGVGIYYIVTARDASKKERKIVYGKEKI